MTVPTWEISKKKCPNCKKKLTKVTKKGNQLSCGFCGYGLAGLLSGGPAYNADPDNDGDNDGGATV